MNGGIDPEHHGTGHIHKFMYNWKENLDQARMIRGLKNIVLFCFGIMFIELVLIVLLILRG